MVTGATGRVGSLAVRRLLELYPNVLVRAVVTDMAKGKRLLKEEIDKYGIKLEVRRQQIIRLFRVCVLCVCYSCCVLAVDGGVGLTCSARM